ncbi:MAG: bifunctional serine/threonine-protein kinase/formylglycine-generating enzyme family protein [Planctomycetota bacterium]
MSSDDDLEDEELVGRFFDERSEWSRESFESWIGEMPAIQGDPDRLERVRELFERCVELAGFFGAETASADREDAAPRPVVEPGDTVAGYRILRFLARGGMGEVWEAEEVDLRRRVALKFILAGRVEDRALEQFRREARAGAGLQHPGIVTTLAYGEEDELAWIAQELVPGSRTIRDFIEEMRTRDVLPRDYDRRIAELVARVAEGLEYAHANGVIHRDVKPSNVLVGPDGAPRLTDFGLARVVDESLHSLSGEVKGTWAYMSPEQVEGRTKEIDHRTDVFSLGIVLYELLTLRRPFEGDTTQQIARSILSIEPTDPNELRSQCPRDLGTIAQRALEKEPTRRYPAAGAFSADLRRFLAHEPIAARRPSVVDRAWKWTRRNPVASSVTAIVALALIVVSGLLVRLSRVNDSLAAETERSNELLAQATNASRSATEARARAEAERNEAIKTAARLATKGLVVDARQLWPVDPSTIPDFKRWLDRAQELIDRLPGFRRERDALRVDGAPPPEDEVARDPEAARLRALEARIAARRSALRVLQGQVDPADPPRASAPDDDSPPTDRLLRAWSLVEPGRVELDRESEGLALALETLDDAPEEIVPNLWAAVAWGRWALGDVDGAREASEEALASTPPDRLPTIESLVDPLQPLLARARTRAGRVEAEEEAARLVAEAASLRARVAERHPWRYPDDLGDRALVDRELTDLILGLEALEQELIDALTVTREHGWSVGRRTAFASRLERGFAPGGEFDAMWQEALPSIRSRYPELDLQPQMGLVPLGEEPTSGLWEFAHLASGEIPTWTETGAAVDEFSCLVFVLVPGGSAVLGAQSTDPSAPNYDPAANPTEGPVHAATISASFVSKFEMTQGQWLRLTGDEPSSYSEPPLVDSRLHPVEGISWADCERELPRFGLALPTESTWEYAARAGTSTPWSIAGTRAELAGRINIADASAAAAGARWPAISNWPDHDDGSVVHWEVDRGAVNPFGLYGIHGNVRELCLDRYLENAYAGRDGSVDPWLPFEGGTICVVRGGSFGETAADARSANRSNDAIEATDFNLGVRPVRAIDGGR